MKHVSIIISTMPDSLTNISPDTVGNAPQPVEPWGVCRDVEAPLTADEMTQYASWQPSDTYASGLIGVMRPVLPSTDSGVVAMLVMAFLLLAFGLRHSASFIKSCWQDLLSVRKRDNAFDDHTTNEARALISLIVMTCISEGIMIYGGLSAYGMAIRDAFRGIMLYSGICAAYFVAQLAAYGAVGYIFATPHLSGQWLKGFTASQALTGLALMAPSVVMLFNPDVARQMLVLGISLYVLGRIIFICKGFRIFYHKLFSLVYFILYLCTLELIPLILIVKASMLVSSLD